MPFAPVLTLSDPSILAVLVLPMFVLNSLAFVGVAAAPVVFWFNVGILVECIVPALAPAQSTCSAARKLVNASWSICALTILLLESKPRWPPLAIVPEEISFKKT